MTLETLLSEKRIESMRDRVMTGVDADVRRRGRRARLAAGTLAAAVVLVGGVAGVTAVTSGSPETPTFTSADSGASQPDTSQFEAPVPEIAPAPADVANPANETKRDVVTTGQASLVVDDAAEAATDFGGWVESHDGRLDHRSDSDGMATLTVRVPAGQVNAAIDELRRLGDVESTSIDKVDVTATMVDLDARIAALQASIARLTEILTTASTTAEVVEAEANLTQRQAELDSLVAQRTALGEDVSLATLNVSFSQTPTTAKVEPGGFLGGLRTGWNSVVETVNNLATAAGVAAPWLGIAAVLGGMAWLVLRRRA